MDEVTSFLDTTVSNRIERAIGQNLGETAMVTIENLVMRLIDYAIADYPIPFWERVLAIFLDGGLPCGWRGYYPDGATYPEGQLVVFVRD